MFFRHASAGRTVIRVYPEIQTVNFEGKEYFEIHNNCVNEIYNFVPDFGQLRHEWWTCSPSDVICGLCLTCRGKPLVESCKFQQISDQVGTTYSNCCAHFKIFVFKAGVTRNFQIKSYGKPLCPLHKFYGFCRIPLGEEETILGHIYRNHLSLSKRPDFYCLRLGSAVQIILREEEAFLYYKRVDEGFLSVGVWRVGLSPLLYKFSVSFWSIPTTSQEALQESYSFNVPFLHECSSNVVSRKLLIKSLSELSDFIDAERNEIRMNVAVKVKPQ